MGDKRNRKRSRSGAHEACPACGKKLRGEKGLRAHMAAEHGVQMPPSVGCANISPAMGERGARP